MVFADFNAELHSLPRGIPAGVIGKREEHRLSRQGGEQATNVLYMYHTSKATTKLVSWCKGNHLVALNCRRREFACKLAVE